MDHASPAILLAVAGVILLMLCCICCLKRSRSWSMAADGDDDGVRQHLLLEDGIEQPEAISDEPPSQDPRPQRSRHPLAAQFSAMAAATQSEGGDAPIPIANRDFQHAVMSSENYVWPSRGGPSAPINVDWGPTGPLSQPADPAADGTHPDTVPADASTGAPAPTNADHQQASQPADPAADDQAADAPSAAPTGKSSKKQKRKFKVNVQQ
ncbi:Uncharacterized protein PBTT_02540 [Plasmodiophora brassicae]